MNYIIKLFFLVYIAARLAVSGSVGYIEVAVILLLSCSSIYREKYRNSIWLIIAEALLITYSAWHNHAFSALYAVVVYDFVMLKVYWGAVIAVITGISIIKTGGAVDLTMLCALTGYFAYMKSLLSQKEETYKKSYDTERQYRYQLEEARGKLLNASSEVARLTEIKERNRIARDIHDNVGHSIAGILLQLQASFKLRGRDDEKSNAMLEKSITALGDTLEVLRNTVHNIKPTQRPGVDQLKAIVDNFAYCEIDFQCKGDFASLVPEQMEIICSNVKEALTNAGKYSGATKIAVAVDVTDNYTRLYIKDNGKGCSNIKDGLGLSGMRERAENAGGSVSISGQDGFLIVCMLPKAKPVEWEDRYENTDSR